MAMPGAWQPPPWPGVHHCAQGVHFQALLEYYLSPTWPLLKHIFAGPVIGAADNVSESILHMIMTYYTKGKWEQK